MVRSGQAGYTLAMLSPWGGTCVVALPPCTLEGTAPCEAGSMTCCRVHLKAALDTIRWVHHPSSLLIPPPDISVGCDAHLRKGELYTRRMGTPWALSCCPASHACCRPLALKGGSHHAWAGVLVPRCLRQWGSTLSRRSPWRITTKRCCMVPAWHVRGRFCVTNCSGRVIPGPHSRVVSPGTCVSLASMSLARPTQSAIVCMAYTWSCLLEAMEALNRPCSLTHPSHVSACAHTRTGTASTHQAVQRQVIIA